MPPLPDVPLPPGLLAHASRDRGRAQWIAGLPRLLAEVIEDWSLTVDGVAGHGECALVLPVRTDDGARAVLKLTLPHAEAATEHLALRRWGGRGAVALLRADPHRFALLLERLKPRDLRTLPVEDAVAVVAGLYARLHVPPLPQVPRLSDRLRDWCERLTALPRGAPVPRRYVEQAVALGRDLAGDPATDARLLHGDLHDGNVLAGLREPWLAIDPKPLAGDPGYEVAPLLWNRWPAALATGDLRGALRRRLDLACEVADLDADRVRDWTVVRVVVNALGEIEGAAEPDAEWLTRQVTVAKAIQA